ncbi:predicted protein [Histoplasma capsulatum G186AR]|uniref:Uncharacterized protein n=1 Tax=Ajellomyces capsulatus (strain G186AR / H82 / ATCC MYA-2454 / RMSCC 2432) TaxID=447093 RepID=C0NIS5_AJECG|nr:uncharacterized protein HCBG_02332 [Histoplasma capsulatum G186AR]EEH08795.1 predicted protein [Histoplasma capsulatum G186AR]
MAKRKTGIWMELAQRIDDGGEQSRARSRTNFQRRTAAVEPLPDRARAKPGPSQGQGRRWASLIGALTAGSLANQRAHIPDQGPGPGCWLATRPTRAAKHLLGCSAEFPLYSRCFHGFHGRHGSQSGGGWHGTMGGGVDDLFTPNRC